MKRINKTNNNLQAVWNELDLGYEHMERAIEHLLRMVDLPVNLKRMVDSMICQRSQH